MRMIEGTYERFYLNDDVDGIREVENWLKNNLERGLQYELHVGYGDDYSNTIDVHKNFLQEDILEMLDGIAEEKE